MPSRAHPAIDVERLAVLHEVQSRMFGGTAAVQLGRYVVLRPLGRGAMGVVYECYDPELDRRVALKVLHIDHLERGATLGRQRLLREARALAKLSDPHVVAVHDIGLLADGHVYLAMECIDGPSLDRWLATAQRSWREIVDVFLGAGRGLAAAHAAGLVHRDFKPSNVLIAGHGGAVQARVVDFGLARFADAQPSESRGPDGEAHAQSGDLTITGAVLGTPLYMAPEQHRGERADGRADQFAFCVALYEALYRQPPFEGALLDAKESGHTKPPPAGTGVPGWLFRRLQRGLAPRAEDRYPDMHALLRAIRPARARHWWIAGTAAVTAVVAVAAMIRSDAPCEGGEQAFEQAWNDRQRERLHERFAARDGAQTWTYVEPVLDAYASAWIASWRESCEATLVHRVQSQALADRRVACLGRLRTELAATVDALVEPTTDVVRVAGPALAVLDPPTDCDASEVERSPELHGVDASTRERIEGELARAKAALATDDYVAALREAATAVQSTSLLEGSSLRARAQLLHARALSRSGDDEGAIAGCELAIVDAMQARDEHVDAEARSHRIFLLTRLGRTDEAFALRGEAIAATERTGDPRLAMRLYATLAMLSSATGRLVDASEAANRSVDAAMASGPDGLLVADARVARASALAEAGDTSSAIVDLDEALAIYERRLGPDHARAANARYGLGTALFESGRPAEAKAQHEACLATRRRALAPGHGEIADVVMALAGDEMALGHLDAARRHAEEALAIYRAAYGDRHPDTARAILSLGLVTAELGELDVALAQLDESVRLYAEIHGEDHDRVAEPLFARGVVRLRSGLSGPARVDLESAAARSARMLGPDHPQVAEIRAALAETTIR